MPGSYPVPPALAIPDYWLKAKRALARRDPVMDAILRAHPRIGLRSRGDPFQTLVRAIIGQQISVKAADTVWNRVHAAVGEVRPARFLETSLDRLAACGVSQRKAEYLRDLAHRFEHDLLHPGLWPAMEDEAIIEELVRVRGIGRWTAEMFLMFNLLRPDVLPVDDQGLLRAVGLHYFQGERVGAAEVRVVAEVWRPWRSVATWYLWRSLEPVPVEY